MEKRVRIKPKIRDIVEEYLLTEDLKELSKPLPKKEPLETVEKKKPTLSEKILEGINLLSSCVKPEENEEIKVERIKINKLFVEYPVVVRNEIKPVDIAYLANKLVKTVGGDFSLLKQCADSNFLRKNILEKVRVKYDAIADYFFQKCFESSDSAESLALYLGYSLLLPNKIEKVEDAKKYDEKGRKIINVYTLDFRDIDAKIYGAGISISKYLGLKIKINPCYG
jgi:hypothetical protein